MLTIAIDAEMERHLEALGAHSPDGKIRLARERLLDALREDREDREWARIAGERLSRPEKTWSLEEVAKELDLDR